MMMAITGATRNVSEQQQGRIRLSAARDSATLPWVERFIELRIPKGVSDILGL